MGVKGLHKMIYPFAPDQSGAVSVLYMLGGMIIIVDAGGCAGNICGFDEPRWLDTKSAIFSAGLRDMDAILGRDELMIDKIAAASKKLEAGFIAIVGTPVPRTIATDYKAIRRMTARRTGLPVITMDTSGAAWYDDGIDKAYTALIREFTENAGPEPVTEGMAGVLGMTPLDTGMTDASEAIKKKLKLLGYENVICYGDPGTLAELGNAGKAERNIVISTSGLGAARLLKEKYGTPYECFDPLVEDVWEEIGIDAGSLSGKSVLIMHQQIRANSLRNLIREKTKDGNGPGRVDVATWFRLDDEIKEEGDFRIREESDFFDMIQNGGYDVIFADRSLKKAAKGYDGIFADLPHFAVSGRM